MKLEQVSGNISELLSAAENDRVVVPDLSGEGLNSGYGVSWLFYRIVYIILELFYPGIELENFRSALEKTDRCFKEQAEALEENCKRYDQFLQAKISNPEGTLSDGERATLAETRAAITEWANLMGHFSPKKLDPLIKKVSTIYAEAFEKREETGTFEKLFQQAALSRASAIQKVVNLESFSSIPVPFSTLEKLATRDNANKTDNGEEYLSESEKKAVDEWIDNLSQITIQDLDEGLKGFIALLDDEKFSLALLQWELKRRGCTVFDEPDREFERRWEQLQDGDQDTLSCNGKELKIGARIAGEEEEDSIATFALVTADYEERAIQVARNGAFLRIAMMELLKTQHDPIPMASFVELDKDGHCALIERLSPLETSFSWLSTRHNEIVAEDREQAKKIVSMVKGILQMRLFPSNFSLDAVRVNQLREIRAGKRFKWREFDPAADFLKLVSILEACSAGNRYVFRHMLGATLFRDFDPAIEKRQPTKVEAAVHPNHKFFNLCITKALEGDPLSVEEICKQEASWVVHADTVARGKKLQKEMKELKQQCYSEIEGKYTFDEAGVESAINKMLKNLYYKYGLSLSFKEPPKWIVGLIVQQLIDRKIIIQKENN